MLVRHAVAEAPHKHPPRTPMSQMRKRRLGGPTNFSNQNPGLSTCRTQTLYLTPVENISGHRSLEEQQLRTPCPHSTQVCPSEGDSGGGGRGQLTLGEPWQPGLSPVRRQEGSAFQATPRATKLEGDAESPSWPPADLPGSTRWMDDVHDN